MAAWPCCFGLRQHRAPCTEAEGHGRGGLLTSGAKETEREGWGADVPHLLPSCHRATSQWLCHLPGEPQASDGASPDVNKETQEAQPVTAGVAALGFPLM